MKLRVGNMFDHLEECEALIVTTNSYIKKDGSLVMGRGAALELKQKWPQAPIVFGRRIKHLSRYGVVIYSKDMESTVFGAFQVKYNFLDKADIDLIKHSVLCLQIWIEEHFADWVVFLNYPGIGNGGLRREEVEPIISVLPDNVHVWIKN